MSFPTDVTQMLCELSQHDSFSNMWIFVIVSTGHKYPTFPQTILFQWWHILPYEGYLKGLMLALAPLIAKTGKHLILKVSLLEETNNLMSGTHEGFCDGSECHVPIIHNWHATILNREAEGNTV